MMRRGRGNKGWGLRMTVGMVEGEKDSGLGQRNAIATRDLALKCAGVDRFM